MGAARIRLEIRSAADGCSFAGRTRRQAVMVRPMMVVPPMVSRSFVQRSLGASGGRRVLYPDVREVAFVQRVIVLRTSSQGERPKSLEVYDVGPSGLDALLWVYLGRRSFLALP